MAGGSPQHVTLTPSTVATVTMDADYRTPASRICNAVSGYEITERGGFSGVRVAASDGQRLVWRRQLSDSCKARS